MRRALQLSLTYVALAAAVGCSVSVQNAASAPDAAAVTHAFHLRSDGLQAAESAKDATTSASFYADDAVLQPAGMPQLNGRANILELYKAFFANPALRELRGTPTKVEVSASGDMAYEVGVNRIVMGSPSGNLLDMGKYVIVWKYEKGDWYVKALSFTSDAAAPVKM